MFNSIGKKNNDSDELAEMLVQCIENAKFYFIKNITNTMVSFLSQAYFMKQL